MRRFATKSAVLWLALGIGAILAGVAVLDLERRQKLIRLVGADLRAASERLSAQVAIDLGHCPALSSRAEIGNLADAFIAVESLAASLPERTFEALLVDAARFAGVRLPDISIGPGQVRISTAMAAARRVALQQRELQGLTEQEVAELLLSRCGSRRLVALVLEMKMDKHAVPAVPLDRKSIGALASSYNGQETTSDDEAAMANLLYRELVYHVFQDLRFRRAAAAHSQEGR